MNPSSYLDDALEIIASVRGKPLKLEERKPLAVELATYILREANKNQTYREKKQQRQLAKLIEDPLGKAFTVAFTDEGLRSSSYKRVASQLIFLLEKFGIPEYFSPLKKMQLFAFKLGAKLFPFVFVPMVIFSLRKQTSRVILPGEKKALEDHIKKRIKEGVRLNLNHLGEAIQSEEEAERRLGLYLEDLQNPLIDYVSIKISNIYSQINLLAQQESIENLAKKLRLLYQAALDNKKEGESKFVNLDMEEYKDLHLTIAVFKKVLEEPAFFPLCAGVVLQAYLPDSFRIQKDLTLWAKNRVKKGGSPIKIRIVKGANLGMEQVEASLKNWEQAPFTTKVDVDANFKKMVSFGCIPENARAAHLGIASHNLFDIAYAILLRVENQVEAYSCFEMLEGMAEPLRKAVQNLTGQILLYCPVAKKEDFQHAIAYLIRRLDENTGAENFLRHMFRLKPGSPAWEEQTELFLQSCDKMASIEEVPRRKQNRVNPVSPKERLHPFENESDTDFSLPQNQIWAENLRTQYEKTSFPSIPLCIGGKEVLENEKGEGKDPSRPEKPLFRYMLGGQKEIELALHTAKKAEKGWREIPFQRREEYFYKASQLLREKRGEFLGVMMANTAKTFSESDPEISEAIDNLDFYRNQLERYESMKDLSWEPKGTFLVTPPWNFPLAIPLAGITGALLTGNCVLFKPAPEAILVGWYIAKLLWEAGIPKEVLQFLNVADNPEGSSLVQNPLIDGVVLTGSTQTAQFFLQLRPELCLIAETGGKNALILSDLCDRDLAIRDLLVSAFSHAGQKCSATSLAILEKNLYDDHHFLRQLKEAASSLKVGSAYNFSTKIPPLITVPGKNLKKALETLEEGEEWLLQPFPHPHNPHIWSPGIKKGVKLGSFTQTTELFGPVLGLIRAENLTEAFIIANHTQYGLTSGLYSLDEREHQTWTEKIEAGNLYINRTTTGAIVKRQPFGGCKKSSFGRSFKAGGPNYLLSFMKALQKDLPKEKAPVNEPVNQLTYLLEKLELSAEKLGEWYLSISNYSFWWQKLKGKKDPTKIVGQDNFFYYVPEKGMIFRIYPQDPPLEVLKICAAFLTCNPLSTISYDPKEKFPINLSFLPPPLSIIKEEEEVFLKRVELGEARRIRLCKKGSKAVYEKASRLGIAVLDTQPLISGRIELLHYLREVSLSVDYHRYGNLGLREQELRRPIL